MVIHSYPLIIVKLQQNGPEYPKHTLTLTYKEFTELAALSNKWREKQLKLAVSQKSKYL